MTKTILEVLEENNIPVTKRGERWVARCPLHEGDRNPSFTIYPDLSWYCFGCQKGGDLVNYLQYMGVPWERAIEYAGVERRSKPVKRVIKVQNVMQIYPYLYDVAEQYHQFLLLTPGALNYLRGRGLTDETIREYKIGYTDGGIIDPQTAYDYGLARDSGVISEDSKTHNYWESLSHRITIPNLHGDLCDFLMGRTVGKDKVKYLGLRIPKPIYGLESAMKSRVLYLVEGHFDWLILKQWGYPAICTGGTSVPPYNLIPLKSRHVVIVPDNDKEGLKAAKNLHEKLPDSRILEYSDLEVKDVGELGVMGNGKELFDQKVLEQVKWEPNTSMIA